MFVIVRNVFQFSYWQRCTRWQTINQIKNVLLLSKVFCICVCGIHICNRAFAF